MRQGKEKMKKIIMTLLLIFSFTYLYSGKVYRVLSRGAVRDNSTDLIWTRCSIGEDNKPIYDFKCKGTKKRFTWQEAIEVCNNLVHEGRSDWRLPSVKELQSIVYNHHYSSGNQYCSQINEEAFPNVITDSECLDFWKDGHFWSSTTHKSKDSSNNNYVWFVDFKWGNTGFSVQSFMGSPVKKYVRCVAGP